jgi:acetolactate synthase-1/2/3 large subunit
MGEIATKRYTLPKPGVPLIHLDILAEEIGRCVPATVPLWGDAQAGLEDLAEAIGLKQDRPDYRDEVGGRMAKWREEVRERLESDEVPVSMARMCHELTNLLPEEAIVVADGGFAAHWTGLFYDTKTSGRGYVPDRGFASIGYGLPGALGAWLAAPDRPVVAVTGDGGLNMTLGDLETVRRAGANITICVVNNAASGYVKALQHAAYGAGCYQSSDLNETNYAGVARAMDCAGIRVERPAELRQALETALAERGRPTVIDIVSTRDPAAMLPGIDARTMKVKPGDRPI